ncbi:hypothetical protein AgCh_005883 [Apium graveolens]
MGAHQRRWLHLQVQQAPSPRYHCRHFCSPPDPLVEDNNGKIRRRNALLKPKDKYQAELSHWELLSNTLRDLNLQTQNVEKRSEKIDVGQRGDELSVEFSGFSGCALVDELLAQGVGGIVELAPGYLSAVHSTIKKAGGLFISDEVQSGFARTGSHFRGFESHDVVPDIVRMAKILLNRTNRINEGPHKPTKLSVVVASEPAKSVPKEKSDYTAEDISSIAKDAKVRHLLHSAIDNVMSNRVINCKTAKEIWDALETRCKRTNSIKKNRKNILTQEYEHFDSKPDESLTALPESWDLKATTIRDNYNLEETTLDEIYGMLKTHELEMEQRNKRKGRKSRTVALKAEEESPKAAASRKGKGKALITKSDTESSSSDTDDDSETESLPKMDPDEEMMKLCALMVKGITRIAYRKFRKGKKFSRKGASSDKKSFRKSEGKGGKSDRGDYTNVKCYNCGEKGHISPDCKKVRSDKGKALVTKKKSWTDTSNSESEVNYALMANADSSSDAAELKVPQITYTFHTDDINELRRYLKTMFISYRDQTLTYERLTSENLAYKKRNDYLEKELVMFHQTPKDRDDAFYVRDEIL